MLRTPELDVVLQVDDFLLFAVTYLGKDNEIAIVIQIEQDKALHAFFFFLREKLHYRWCSLKKKEGNKFKLFLIFFKQLQFLHCFR